MIPFFKGGWENAKHKIMRDGSSCADGYAVRHKTYQQTLKVNSGNLEGFFCVGALSCFICNSFLF